MIGILLFIEGLIKVYSGVIVNDFVFFDIKEGEVYVLFGENGVGKFMLVKMVYGLVKLDSGIMIWCGVDFVLVELWVVWVIGVVMVF